jgi:hypothetical protein
MKCLWIARDQPFPQDAGDKVYSANLACALAEAGVMVSFLSFAAGASRPPRDTPVHWRKIPGHKRSPRRALLSHLPIAGAIHDTPAFRQAFEAQLQESWDAIIFDSYGSGWALRRYLASQRAAGKAPILVHVSHNQEGVLWHDMVRNSDAGWLKKLALWQNWLKVRFLERFVLRHVDLISAISQEDALAFKELAPECPSVVLTPGYSGERQAWRVLGRDGPKHVVLIGSFRWVVKQENLRQFIDLADATFHRHGITFDVIGDMPQALRAELTPRLKATVLHGFVDDVAPLFNRARLAVVPEMIGGGFKLKFLDYIFQRLPVATIDAAAAGLPPTIRSQLLLSADLQELVDSIVQHIDHIDMLNHMQQEAFEAASQLYQWGERGIGLRDAIASCQQARSRPQNARSQAACRMETS